jgi:molecular chaperone GrpE
MISGDEMDDVQDGDPVESDDFDEDIEDLEAADDDGADEADDDVDISPKPIVLTPEEQVSELKDQLLRALAETQNVRRRADRDRTDASKYAVTNFARDMLTVADNLRRTIESAKPGSEPPAENAEQAFMEGVEMTERDLLASLERHGIKQISPMGEKFDHNFHQAMFEMETADKDPGVIVQVVQEGFVIGERLLRPAMVGVAKAPASPDHPEQNAGDPDGESGINLDTEA